MKTIVLYDAPQVRTRQRIESILRAHGYTWLFLNARWSARAVSTHLMMLRSLRARLSGQSYRIAIIEVSGRTPPHVRWLAAVARAAD